MPALQRNSAPRGVRFYIDTVEGVETIMFLHVIDACTRNGPRAALTEDMEEHPAEWSAFEEGTAYLPPGSVPLITFSTPEGAEIPKPTKAKGERAPA